MQLNALEYPASDIETKEPMIIAHGLFGSAKNWNTHARKLATDRKVYAVDMRNHGDSGWHDDQTYEAMASDLNGFIETHVNAPCAVLGHSMGGKAAMMLALMHPESITKLIVADIAPVTYTHSHDIFIDAMQSMDLSQITRRSQADPMLASAIPEAPLRAFILQNLKIESGIAGWRINLQALQNGMESMIGFPETENRFEKPSLFIYGTASDYVTDKNTTDITNLFPQADISAIEGAGHWLHHEKPKEFLQIIEGWL